MYQHRTFLPAMARHLVIHWSIRMIHAKHYESAFKFVKVMPRNAVVFPGTATGCHFPQCYLSADTREYPLPRQAITRLVQRNWFWRILKQNNSSISNKVIKSAFHSHAQCLAYTQTCTQMHCNDLGKQAKGLHIHCTPVILFIKKFFKNACGA